jgi:hypothetical protein
MAAAICVAVASLGGPAAARAQTDDAEQRRTTLVFYTENDDWWPDTGTDKNYTNAFRVTIERNYDVWSLQRRFPKLFGWVPTHVDCSFVSPYDHEDLRCTSSSWHVLGQQFYTPDDITIPDLIPTDRPYAGWLYLGGSWKSSTASALTATDVYLGLTGEPSLAEPVQSFWHRLVGASDPKGWAHQVDGRFGVIVGHSRRKAFDAKIRDVVRVIELVPYAGGTLGNIVTDGYAGFRLKVGYNISRDWTQTGLAPRVGPAMLGRLKPQDVELYLVLDGQGRALAYNSFIDAAPEHTLDRNYLVADGGLGVGFRFKGVSVSYRVAFVTPEYDEAQTHDYKAIRVTVGF